MTLVLNKSFFDFVRANVFHARHMTLDQTSVDCIGAIVEQAIPTDKYFHIAYVLATAFHEAKFEWYIREVGRGAGKPYGKPDPVTGYVYYGRGLPQLTHKPNYEKFGYANDPDDVLQKDISVGILWKGMREGKFTGKKLSDFDHLQNTPREMYRQMRSIVNGTDKMELIAGYASEFALALMSATAYPSAMKPSPAAVSKSDDKPPATQEKSTMEKLLMLPTTAASMIGLAVKYGPTVASSAATAVSNYPDIKQKGTDMIDRLKRLDFEGAMVDFNAILADLGLTHEHVTTATATAANEGATLSPSIF